MLVLVVLSIASALFFALGMAIMIDDFLKSYIVKHQSRPLTVVIPILICLSISFFLFATMISSAIQTASGG